MSADAIPRPRGCRRPPDIDQDRGLAQRLDQLAGGADEEALGHRRAADVADAHLQDREGPQPHFGWAFNQ